MSTVVFCLLYAVLGLITLLLHLRFYDPSDADEPVLVAIVFFFWPAFSFAFACIGILYALAWIPMGLLRLVRGKG